MATQGPEERPLPENPLFRGDLLRLSAFDPEADAEIFARWSEDPLWIRLGTDYPPVPTSKTSAKSEIEEMNKQWPKGIWFALRTLSDDRLNGMVGLKDINWAHGPRRARHRCSWSR